jgi:anti-anti-sigma regulatory factor
VQAVPVDSDAWQVISILPRLDAESHADLMSEIHKVLAGGARYVALDLTQNRFFSLNAIQFCVSLARDLAFDDGRLALIGGGERTKRHFEVYGSLKEITVVRTINELVQGRTNSVVMRPRSSSSLAAG